MKTKQLVKSVTTALIGAAVIASTTTVIAASPKTEKCYGISKAKKNDCGTPQHACAGQARKDNDSSEWITVLKGNCQRIVGGSTSNKE